MSLKDAKIRYLSQELDEQERKIHMMKDDAMAPGNPGAGSTEERIVFLEKKTKEIEALVKGLTEELLDLKAITMRLSRSAESRADIRRVQPAGQPGAPAAAPSSSGSTVVMQKRGRADAPATPAAQASQAPEEQMDLIMQTDGTMKMEKRRGDKNYIIATGNFRKGGGKGDSRKPREALIVAEDDEKADSKKK